MFNVYVQGYALINPREQNGVSNLKGKNPTPAQIANNTTVMCVPDQCSFRTGASLQTQKIVLTAGLRYETVPENDLIGGNKGFRRAASISSVAPGLTYKMKSAQLLVYMGIPFKCNIIQNPQNDITSVAFADWLVSFSVQFKL